MLATEASASAAAASVLICKIEDLDEDFGDDDDDDDGDLVDAEQVLLLEAAMEEKARGAKAVVEAEAARSNQEEKCRNFIGW